ncbi:MAG: hypothetical protein CL624_04480 [Arcobacter sp.]|nr:hypothetical protein [Arcobacter sp.]
MILSRTDELLKELDNLNTLKELANDSQGFFKRSQELKTIDTLLSSIVDIIVLFRNQGFKIETESIFDNFIKSFKILKDKWEKDKKSLLESNQFIRNNNLSTIISDIKFDLLTKWKKYIQENKPNLNMEQLDILENIPDLSTLVEKLKNKLFELNELKSSLPNSGSEFISVISITKDMNELWDNLSSQNIPKEAMTFLKRAGTTEGIELSEVTPGILLWLQEHKLTSLCHVRFVK